MDFNIAFKAPNTIGNLFPLKDKVTNVLDMSLVVYQIDCKTCGAKYIGKTQRILSIRIQEHQKSLTSSCKQYEVENPEHTMEYENVEVIDQASSDKKLKMKELLHILKKEPVLNKQVSKQSKYEVNTLIINAYPQHRS